MLNKTPRVQILFGGTHTYTVQLPETIYTYNHLPICKSGLKVDQIIALLLKRKLQHVGSQVGYMQIPVWVLGSRGMALIQP